MDKYFEECKHFNILTYLENDDSTNNGTYRLDDDDFYEDFSITNSSKSCVCKISLESESFEVQLLQNSVDSYCNNLGLYFEVNIHNPRNTFATYAKDIRHPQYSHLLPYVELLGNGWQAYKQQLFIFMSLATNKKSSDIDWYQLTLENDGFYRLKDCKLTVNRAFNKKLVFSIFFGEKEDLNRFEIGTFESKSFHVLPKITPKQKNYSFPTIQSDQQIGLFVSYKWNRKYLTVQDDTFRSSTKHWENFFIYLINDEDLESEEFCYNDGVIHYGQTIKIIGKGLALPQLIIRELDSNFLVINSFEPVCQLKKCALFLKNSDRLYLCASPLNDNIMSFQSTLLKDGTEILNEGSMWTLTATGTAQYRFHSYQNCIPKPVTIVPILKQFDEFGGNWLELIGENFTPYLKVWFGNVKSEETIYRCSDMLICKIPTSCIDNSSLIEIILVRNDGVVYPTGLFYPKNAK